MTLKGLVGVNARERPHSSGGKDSAEGSNTTNTARRLAQSAGSMWLRWRNGQRLPPDSSRAGLRRAARAALVMPATFAFALLVIRDSHVSTFVALGCFALLVLADFGGDRRPRALAYAAAIGIGAVLIALGTLASGSPWGAALVMLLVGFAVTFAGVFGGYAAAARTALLLVFVLAVSIPAPPAAIAPRLAGWLIAGMVSLLAGVFLWPHFERVALHRQAASACRAVGRLIQVQRSRADPADAAQARGQVRQVVEATQAAEAAVSTAHQTYAATAKRPDGPARRDRAFVELLSELERIVEFAARPLLPSRRQLSAQHPCLREGDQLATAVMQILDTSAAALIGGGPPPDVQGLRAAWRAHREMLDRWAALALHAGTGPEDVLDGLKADDTLRVVAYLTLALGSNVAITTGAQMATRVGTGANDLPAEIPLRTGATGFILRVGKTIRTQLAPTSSVLHNSLRVALALGLAVLIARLFQLDHAFWVVLGTLSALCSNALATGRTTLQVLAGTLVGFAIGATFLVLVGTSSAVLWIALPVAVFIAAYAASASGFFAGQAAFTVVVLILFNLIAPAGWLIGVARVEDVAVGVGISITVSVLLWPRGARGELRATLAALYRAVADRLTDAFGRILGPGLAEESGRVPGRRGDEVQSEAEAARDRAREALDRYLHERRAKSLSPQVVGSLAAAGADAILAAELLDLLADSGYRARARADGSGAVAAMIGQMQALVAAYLRLADQLDGAKGDASRQGRTGISPTTVRAAALSSLRQWSQDPEDGRAAIAVVVVGEWVEHLGALVVALEDPVAKAAA